MFPPLHNGRGAESTQFSGLSIDGASSRGFSGGSAGLRTQIGMEFGLEDESPQRIQGRVRERGAAHATQAAKHRRATSGGRSGSRSGAVSSAASGARESREARLQDREATKGRTGKSRKAGSAKTSDARCILDP